MKNHTTKIAITLILLLSSFASGCVEQNNDTIEDKYIAQFISYNDFGIYADGFAEFTYDKSLHQIYQSGNKLKFYITNDLATTYIKFNMATNPSNGGKINATIMHSMTPNDVIETTFEIVKTSEMKLWLWSKDDNIGIILLK